MMNRNAGCDPQPKFIDNAKLLDGNSTYAHGSYPVKGFTRVVTYTGGKIFTPGGNFLHRGGFLQNICSRSSPLIVTD